ncbi:PepSY domain-containing protein [Hansschlegelia quercus]|uniref:PepSY domain-containing protein n=1 Tax=Hansschlegelia quercus TaxID=2528245 RepID=A0A4Q9GG12_9HYPH|nr:PepSY domain-containing protein [Hansschlegelia quercus]TBN51806.1 hypothetical protein EYR15_12965 [Hansschlegelia quercus]
MRFALGLITILMIGGAAGAQEPGGPGPDRSTLSNEARSGQNASRLGMPQAIEIAEKSGQGRAVGATFSPFAQGGGSHEVIVLKADGSLARFNIDANTGNVIGVTNQILQSYVTRLTPDGVGSAKTSLLQAISVAEGGKARAIGAQTEQNGDTVSYEITVAGDGGERSVHVAGDGKILPD